MKRVLSAIGLSIQMLGVPFLTKADCEDTLIHLGQKVQEARENRDYGALRNDSLKLLDEVAPCYKQGIKDNNLGLLFYYEAELEVALSGLAISQGPQAPPKSQNPDGAESSYRRMIAIYAVMKKQAPYLPDPYHKRQLQNTANLINETRQEAGLRKPT